MTEDHRSSQRARLVRARLLALALLAVVGGLWLFWVSRGGMRWTGSEPAIFITSGDTIGLPHEVTVVQTGRALKDSDLRNVIDTALEKAKWLMSPNDPGSELSRFNASNTGEPVRISAETAELVACALDVWQLSGGTFDLSLGPLHRAYASGADLSDSHLEALRGQTGMDKVTLDAATLTLKKSDPRLVLDTGPLFAGYAADLVARGLDRRGVENYHIEVGGQRRTKGLDASAAPWRVALDNAAEGRAPHDIELGDSALGVARAGAAPVVDARTGRRATHTLETVWVLHPEAMRAQAYAHAILVLGLEDGLLMAKLLKVPVLLSSRSSPGALEDLSTPDFDARLRASAAGTL